MIDKIRHFCFTIKIVKVVGKNSNYEFIIKCIYEFIIKCIYICSIARQYHFLKYELIFTLFQLTILDVTIVEIDIHIIHNNTYLVQKSVCQFF